MASRSHARDKQADGAREPKSSDNDHSYNAASVSASEDFQGGLNSQCQAPEPSLL